MNNVVKCLEKDCKYDYLTRPYYHFHIPLMPLNINLKCCGETPDFIISTKNKNFHMNADLITNFYKCNKCGEVLNETKKINDINQEILDFIVELSFLNESD